MHATQHMYAGLAAVCRGYQLDCTLLTRLDAPASKPLPARAIPDDTPSITTHTNLTGVGSSIQPWCSVKNSAVLYLSHALEQPESGTGQHT
jgi:hypothetical protein